MAIARRTSSNSRQFTYGDICAMLQKLVLLSILAALCFSALVFPFRLPDRFFLEVEGISPTEGWWPWLYHTQLRSMFVYTHSPLVLKEAVAQGFLLAVAFGILALLVLKSLGSDSGNRPWRERLQGWLGNPISWVILLLCYLGATVLVSPTFHYSLRNLFAFSLALLIPLSFFALRPGTYFIGKFMLLILGCGTVIGGIALLQHLGFARWFLPAYDDPRNRMSSLIGHNTGMSSWLMFPMSFAVYYLHMARKRWQRYLALALLLLFGFVILAAQSRAIWVLGAGVVFLNFAVYFRLQGRRVTRRTVAVIAVCLFGLIALQTVAPRINPFARTPMSFFERMRRDVLNPQQLMRETRLRIMAVSFSELVAKNPILGSGFGTFQWVYPPAQGRYFQKHINDTNLGFTTKRTDLAHNDYLQLLVEAGLVGVLLLGIPTFLLVRSGRRAYIEAESTRNKARLLTLATPTAAVAVHALVDFPFHVAPIGLLAAASFGLLASQGNATSEATEQPAIAATPAESVRWRAVVLGGVFLFSCFWIPFAGRNLVYKEFASDIYMSDASNWLRSFRAAPATHPERQIAMLQRAQPLFRRAIHLNVFNGAAYEGQASLFASRGNLLYTMGRRAALTGDLETAEKYYMSAKGDMDLTIAAARNQMTNGELSYHFTYYLIGTAYRTLWLLNPNPEDIRQFNYLKSAREAFERAIETNIADTTSLSALADLLDSTPLNDSAAANRHLAMIFRIDEDYGRRTMLEPAIKMAAEGNVEGGLGRLQRLAPRLPKLAVVDFAFAWCYFYASVWLPPELDRIEVPAGDTVAWRKQQLGPGIPILDKHSNLDEKHQQELQLLRAHYAAAQLDFDTTLELATPLAASDLRAEALRDIAQEEKTGSANWRADLTYDRYRGTYGVYLKTGESKKESGFKLGVTAALTKIDMAEALRLLHFTKANGWDDVTRIVLDLVRKYYPTDARLNEYQPNTPVAE